MNALDANYFDQWYADMAASPRREQIQQRHLGLPPHLLSTSLLTWAGIDDVVAALEVGADDVFVDLACGRGGYGLEVAHRTGASLIGIDFSAVALDEARRTAAKHWGTVAARFEVGDLTATGLPDASAAAIMCIDAMQFARPYPAALTECLRVLEPGGRLVLTGWQARPDAPEPIPERLRHDIGATVTAAGFVDVQAREMRSWQRAERAMWEAVVEEEPGGDPAIEALRAEGERVLPTLDHIARMLVSAAAPQRHP